MTTGKRAATTAIGSLPHHNADVALGFSFRLGIPFLPQIPIRNPWEYMIAQALEGLPGLQADIDGSVTLNTDIWLSRSSDFQARLDAALAHAGGGVKKTTTGSDPFEGFEPSPSISSCWQPFLWELSERRVPMAKIQLAGPMTAQWALMLRDNAGHDIPAHSAGGAGFGDQHPELFTQIYRLVLARAIAMSRRLQRSGIQPLLFLDEPGLYALSPANARHVLALQELKLLIQALRKEGVLVGLHCCSNTDWNMVLSLPLNYLSLDVALSLDSLLEQKPAFDRFVRDGGKLSLGVIPTGRSSVLRSLDIQALANSLIEKLPASVLRDALFTPACGLALQSATDAELILDYLIRFEAIIDGRDLR